MWIVGKVKRGLGIGTKLGYPTANLECGGGLCPIPGVYAARVAINGAPRDAVAVVGARSEDAKPLLEVHLLDFEDDLSGKELAVEILNKISEIENFSNDEKLKSKIEEDIRKARLCLQE
ncbi:riboflavin kinase [Candidatus Uhrbacteria bacterium]|nr:riboflavin kinase [Candidatus Uhrbacteria bacterium]